MKSRIILFATFCFLVFNSGCVQNSGGGIPSDSIVIDGTSDDLSCKDIEFFFDKITCYNDLAFKQRDYTMCRKIKGDGQSPEVDEFRDNCYLRVIRAISQDAISKKSPDLCEKLPDDKKEECYVGSAFIDPSICENKVSSVLRDHCYYAVARDNKDILFCEKIKSPRSQNDCGYSTLDDSTTLKYCDGITVDSLKQQCLGQVASNLNDPELCEKVSGNWSEKCWRSIAFQRTDPEYCKRISTSFYKRDCTYWVVRKSANTSLCSLFESQDDKDYCLTGIVIDTHNATICDLVVTPIWKNKCKGYAY